MAKHKITVQANGMTFTVETDASTILIAGVQITLSDPEAPPAQTKARFPTAYASSGHPLKIRAIKAARMASCSGVPGNQTCHLGLREAKDIVESGGSFSIHPDAMAEFQAYCQSEGLNVTYN